jgi:glycosyltransferase involved in cell wall biosynthesis
MLNDEAMEPTSLNVAIVCGRLDRVGGMEEHVASLCVALTDAGHRVCVYSKRYNAATNPYLARILACGASYVGMDERTDARIEVAGRFRTDMVEGLAWLAAIPLLPLVPVDALARRRSPARSWHGLRGLMRAALDRVVPAWTAQRLGDIWLNRVLARHLPADRPHVAHLHRYDTLGLLATSALRHVPRVYTEHGTPSATWDYGYSGREVNHADVVIAVSAQSAEALRGVWGCTRPVSVVPSMVADPGDDASQRAGARQKAGAPPTATFIGRVDENKNVVGLVRAFSRVVVMAPDARLVVAGDGPSMAEVRREVDSLRLGDRVILHGVFVPEQLGEIMAETDLVVLFSHLEGLPVSLIEAMAYGKAMVASAVGGVAELVEHGVTGLLVPAGDERALAVALGRLLTDEEARQSMGRRGRARYLRLGFTPQGVAGRVVDVYRQAMARHAESAAEPSSARSSRQARPGATRDVRRGMRSDA